MNFTFLIILSLLTLGFTYETLGITHKQLCLILVILSILLVTYNFKEKFQDSSSEEDNHDHDQDKFFLLDNYTVSRIKQFSEIKDADRIKNRNILASALEISRNLE